MGRPLGTGATGFRILAFASAIFAIGVVAVSGALLNQAIKFRDLYYYGGYGFSPDYYAGRSFGGYGGGGGSIYGGIGGGGGYFGYQDVGYDIYRYHRVIAIASVALGAGIIQFLVSLLLCCVSEDNAKGLTIGYVAGSLVLFLILVVCFGLGFQYRVIYPYYFYNYYQLYQFPSVYYQYNPEGQAFLAVLGIDLILLLVSAIVAGVFARKAMSYDDRVEWNVRPTTASSANNEYRA